MIGAEELIMIFAVVMLLFGQQTSRNGQVHRKLCWRIQKSPERIQNEPEGI